MADKGKMKCNVVRKSDRAGKKKMVKACSGGDREAHTLRCEGLWTQLLICREKVL